MVKKLLSFVAAAALCFTANAEPVVDYLVDYSTWSEWQLYEMGYKPYIEDGCLTSENEGWYQYFMAPAWLAEQGVKYDVTFYVKGTEAGLANMSFRWSWSEDPIDMELEIPTEWTEVTLKLEDQPSGNIDMIWQGVYAGKFQCAWIKVTHEEGANDQPDTWINILTNGDAEGNYSAHACAYGKELGTNPHPATIEEEEDGNHVFVVHATDIDPETGTPWDNQFWIQAPKAFEKGDKFILSFRYKASKNVSAETQAHSEQPGNYLHWALIGTVNFTTDWQSFSKKVIVDSSQNGMWSCAFNLNADTKEATDFYFDDLKWEIVDDGTFVPEPEIPGTDAISTIAVDANATVEYYSINGVRVANPTTGLYIIKQGDKVSKAYIK